MGNAESQVNRWGTPSGVAALRFLAELAEVREEFQATGPGRRRMDLGKGLAAAIRLMIAAGRRGRKLIFVGNGGSAAIASHQAVDYWKNGGLEAWAFNDASLLTCIGNDCGYENVFAVPISTFAQRGDVLLAISSSGRSPNILNAVKAARRIGCSVITFSGFAPDNPLRARGDVNFYVPRHAYGLVEVSHLALIHAMLREVIAINPRAAKGRY